MTALLEPAASAPPRRSRRPTTITRVARCMSVSVGTTVLSAAILVALALGFGVPAGTANAIGVACGILPSYVGNRRWVWGRTGAHDLRREVMPFWALSIAGLIASTWLVGHVGAFTAAWPTATRAFVLPFAMAAVFGALWVVQFLLLDRVVFRSRDDSSPSAR